MGLSTGDPKLDNSVFALTAKIVFLGRDFGVFGLIDTTGLMLFTYMGRNVDLPGLKMKATKELNIFITDKMFSAGIAFSFDLDMDIPPKHIAGICLGGINGITTHLDIGMTLQILYNQGGWEKDGLVYEVAVGTTCYMRCLLTSFDSSIFSSLGWTSIFRICRLIFPCKISRIYPLSRKYHPGQGHRFLGK